MDITLSLIAVLFGCFFFAGFVDSIAGGGGLITMPSLLLAGVPPHYTLGTAKFASSLGSLTALWTFIRGNFLIWKIAPLGFAASFVGSAFGSWIAVLTDAALMGKIMIFMLPVGLGLSLLGGGLKLTEKPLPEGRGLWWRVFAIGFVIGAYDGFFGPGAGSFFLIGLHVLLGMNLVKASANAKLLNLASNVGALCAFAAVGTVYYEIGIPCAVASILGNRIGARYAMKVGPRFVRKVLYSVLSLLLVTLIYRFFIAG